MPDRTDLAPGLEQAFSFVSAERSGLDPDRGGVAVSGQLPAWLTGTYYLNGPARFSRGALQYRHWLDGDGMVSALSLADGGARLTNRFVRSPKWVAEEGAGRPLFRAFGTRFAGDQLVRELALASPLNVSVYPWAGTLLALGEQGLPMELDPISLETRGPFTFGGALNPLTPFTAHPKIDPTTDDLFGFGVSYAIDRPMLNLYRFAAGASGPEQVYRRRHVLPFPASIHDMALAPRHLVIHLGPYRLDMPTLGAGGTLQDALSFEPDRGTSLLVFDREQGDWVATIPLPTGYVLHTINAFDRADGRLTVDVVELERPVYGQYEPLPDLFSSVGPGGPVRYVLDLGSSRVVERVELPYRLAPDFPAIDPRCVMAAAEDVWLLGISTTGQPGRKFFDQVARVSWSGDLELWQAPTGTYLGGEPAFAPAPDAPGGVVICQQLDTSAVDPAVRSRFLIFDAFDLASGPCAIVTVDRPLALGFHACWAPG